MKRWKILDRDGFSPEEWYIEPGKVVEADTPLEAVTKSCRFIGEATVTWAEQCYLVESRIKESTVYPLCVECGAGKCTGHARDIMGLYLVVVEME